MKIHTVGKHAGKEEKRRRKTRERGKETKRDRKKRVGRKGEIRNGRRQGK